MGDDPDRGGIDVRRFEGLRDWPVSARVAAGVLSALVVVFAFTTVLTANRHDKTKLRTAAPTSTTTSTTLATSDTAFLTTTPSSTASSTTSTSALKPGGVTSQPPTTPAPTSSGGVIVVTTAPRSTTSTTPVGSTNTTAPSGAYCRATASEPKPAAGSNQTVTVTSTLANKDVVVVVHYRTGDVTFPSQGQPPFMTDASGRILVTFSVSQGSKDYPVIVDVNVGGPEAICETNFRPSS